MTFQEACKIAYGPHFKQIECDYKPVRHVEPPIANQDKVRKKLIALRIEQKELEELLATNRALQLRYEALIIPF